MFDTLIPRQSCQVYFKHQHWANSLKKFIQIVLTCNEKHFCDETLMTQCNQSLLYYHFIRWSKMCLKVLEILGSSDTNSTKCTSCCFKIAGLEFLSYIVVERYITHRLHYRLLYTVPRQQAWLPGVQTCK